MSLEFGFASARKSRWGSIVPRGVVGQCKPFIGLPGSIFAEVLERRLKRIAELEATPINASKPEIEVKPPMPRLADRRYRRFLNRKPGLSVWLCDVSWGRPFYEQQNLAALLLLSTSLAAKRVVLLFLPMCSLFCRDI